MRVLIPGGSGQIGQILRREFNNSGDEVRVLTRNPKQEGEIAWDGKSLGDWAESVDWADVVINLAGRSVNCRYTKENLKQMKDSRVDSTRVIGQAIAQSASTPKVWLQMSTATIYAHTHGEANDEASGVIGGNEPDAPAYWKLSVDIAQAWERELENANTPSTRKVAMRTSMVMSPDRGGVFDVLYKLTRRGLGGSIGGGQQYVSWIHDRDLYNAIRFLIERDDIDGAMNLCGPNPLRQGEFQRLLRKAAGVRIGLPATAWMVKVGAVFMKTDAELVLKSRRVVPGRLLEAGFEFQFPEWAAATEDLVKRWV